jgi:hypothetical protein
MKIDLYEITNTLVVNQNDPSPEKWGWIVYWNAINEVEISPLIELTTIKKSEQEVGRFSLSYILKRAENNNLKFFEDRDDLDFFEWVQAEISEAIDTLTRYNKKELL